MTPSRWLSRPNWRVKKVSSWEELELEFEDGSRRDFRVSPLQASLILQNALLLETLRTDNAELEKKLKHQRFGEIIGSCPSMLEVYRKVQKVAPTDISVLITGANRGIGLEYCRQLQARGDTVVAVLAAMTALGRPMDEAMRLANRAGGIEGGMTNGEPVVVRIAMKPLPTLMKPLKTATLDTHEPAEALVERSDTTAIYAAAVVAEAVDRIVEALA